MSDNGTRTTQVRTDEPLDRPITLIDATRPQESDPDAASRKTSPSPSVRQPAKAPIKHSIREGLARWKYSKWQQDRYASAWTLKSPNEDSTSRTTIPRKASSQLLQQGAVAHTETETSDFASGQISEERGRKRLSKAKETAPKTKVEKQQSEIDVLYENQRGWFFFGIPLYSHSSLLNFDPSPWMARDGKDSAVNITNAQLPDPSWEWAWKSWYVDMSYDVDEEGWQYSFSFSRNFSWHGTHPWFHCFVRRRRWLRRRVKKKGMRRKGLSDIGAAHNLTSDYFTIHTKRGLSPGSALEDMTTRGSSHISRRTAEDVDLAPEDIRDIPSLFTALRLATIDREKIDALRRFVEAGGAELVYLEEHIPEVMGFLVFQASRRQLLEYLKITAIEATTEPPSDKDEEDRLNNLRNAVRAADREIEGLEYWSDRQHVMNTAGNNGQSHKSTFSESSIMAAPKDDDPVDVIKGISAEAEVGIDPAKRGLSSPSESAIGLRNLHQQVAEAEAELDDKRNDRTEGSEHSDDCETHTPRSLPPDSVKMDDHST